MRLGHCPRAPGGWVKGCGHLHRRPRRRRGLLASCSAAPPILSRVGAAVSLGAYGSEFTMKLLAGVGGVYF